jgi:DtxR family Mn-dependent transcriptional regulator
MFSWVSIAGCFVASLTIENYVKAIYQLTAQVNAETASTGSLAAVLRVSPSTVTCMLKTLRDSELAEHRPYGGVRLTDQGEKLALRVLRRHRLIELFLAQTLQLSWDEVHEEAEHLEHAVSELLVDRIDAYLQYPELDPHGDPIPKSDGSVATATYQSANDCQPGQPLTLCRVLDQSSEFLRFLSDAGLELGVTFEIVRRDRAAGTITVTTAQRETTLSSEAASRLMIQS